MNAPRDLTLRRLRAIEEALNSRLAGEIDLEDAGPPRADYEAALEVIRNRIEHAQRRHSERKIAK